MNNFKLSISKREQTRTDFSNEFLRDVFKNVAHGHNPRNHIGHNCGVSFGRVSCITRDRMLSGEYHV